MGQGRERRRKDHEGKRTTHHFGRKGIIPQRPADGSGTRLQRRRESLVRRDAAGGDLFEESVDALETVSSLKLPRPKRRRRRKQGRLPLGRV